MRLSWNEIRTRAAAFTREWADATYEKGETQSFYNDFFEVFGVKRRSVARYEEHVRKLDNSAGFIDLFWPGVLLVEQKSAGRDLARAAEQAGDYFDALKESERPRYQLVCDFQTFELLDRDEGQSVAFRLEDLPKHVEWFGFIIGVQKRTFRDQDPVNIKASELVGKLHDALEEAGYTGHDLERFLVRIVFCLFADDTGIFEPRDIFLDFLEQQTREDGGDLGGQLALLFQVLNTPDDQRAKTLNEDLNRFPYVNGDLFDEPLRIPSFDANMRRRLIDACRFDWSAISPAIFGSLFQSVMDRQERRALGAHYTTEKNILKVIQPLFLDQLRAEFERLKARRDSRRRPELLKFQEKLGSLTFFDPACGCGNFLIIAYRELRQLEIEVLRELRSSGQYDVLADTLSVVDVDQFYGIEIGEFPARIAETALWMMDHIMNSRLSLEFGETFVRIPLEKSPHIVVENALRLEWSNVLPPAQCSYLFGNPPFVGHQWRTKEQQTDMARIWGRQGQVNRLDYVTCWFKQAVQYTLHHKHVETAFVSTNSITQGEQASILWPEIFKSNQSIRFAHRTFQWNSEARGKAAVHCIIIGLSYKHDIQKFIFEYEDIRGEPHVTQVSRINGYLIEGPQYAIPARSKPPEGRLRIHKGSQPTDGARLRIRGGGYQKFSNLILAEEDRAELLEADPSAEKWLRPYVGGDELISGKWRWCLWLKDADPAELRESKPVAERLERVRRGRLQSPTASVQEYARFPTLFTQDRQPNVNYLAIPEVSSQSREYIPIAILPPHVIASNKLQIIPGASLFYFGILTSAMHMGWMRVVGGRLKSDYSYSPAIYNSFVWPEMDKSQADGVAHLAQEVIDTRDQFLNSSLDDLYDRDTMPPALRHAHLDLDAVVDRLYRKGGFRFERERVEHLFMLYEKMVAPLSAEAAKKPGRRRKARRPEAV